MDQTPRLGLPLLSAGQMQKEEWHNEALLASPPTSPEAGLLYRVAASPSGAWSGQGGTLAVWSAAGWRFVVPFDGLRLIDASDGNEWRFTAGNWQIGKLGGSELAIAGTKVVGVQAAAIATPTGGTTVDAEARTTISAILDALRQHGLIAT